MKHEFNSFATLTYDPKKFQVGGTLIYDHQLRWIKRLRTAVEPQRIRYYTVGEYGEQSGHPHFHAALFGYGPCLLFQHDAFARRKCVCVRCQTIRATWPFGFTDLGSLTQESAQYVAGYVTDKLHMDKRKLNGRKPPKAWMSRKPGIGADSMKDIGLTLMEHIDVLEQLEDVPYILSHGAKKFPLGRYLMQKLRGELGYKDIKTPKDILKKLEMQKLSEYYVELEEAKTLGSWTKIIDRKKQKILNMETRFNIFNGGKRL